MASRPTPAWLIADGGVRLDNAGAVAKLVDQTGPLRG
jgi:hypothetical protein